MYRSEHMGFFSKPQFTNLPDDGKPLLFRVSKLPYFVLFVTLYMLLSLLIFSVLKEPKTIAVLPFFGPIVAAPAWVYLWTSLSGSSFRLLQDRLDLGGSESNRSIRLSDVVLVASSLRRVLKEHAPIILMTRKQRHVIRARLNVSSPRVFQALCERIEQEQTLMHLPSAPPIDDDDSMDSGPQRDGPWPRYTELPAEMLALYNELFARGSAGGALLFRGRVLKNNGAIVTAARPYFLWMIVLSVIGAGLLAMQHGLSELPVAIGFGIAGAFFYGLTFLRAPLKVEWLMVHADGLMMLSPDRTIEIDWVDVKRLYESPSQPSFGQDSTANDMFFIELEDFNRVGIADVYDAPLFVVLRCCEGMLRENVPQ
jgi:hypothetical protein